MANKSKEISNNSPLDFSNQGLIDFLRSEALRTEKKRDDNASAASQVEVNLCSQLMLLSTVLLTGSVVWFNSRDVTKSLTSLQTSAILLMILFLFASISAGIKYYFTLNKFFEDWAKSEDKVSDVYRDKEFATWGEAIKKIEAARAGLENISDRKWLKIQIALLGLSAVSLILLVCGVMFDFTRITAI